MADVTMTMSSDEAKVLRGMQKIIGKEREMAQGATKSGAASKRASDKAVTGWASVKGAVMGAVGGLVGVGGLKAALGIIREEMRKTAEAGEKTMGILQLGIAKAGDIKHYGAIEKRLRGMKGPGADLFSMEQRGQVYEGVRGALPLSPRGQVVDLTEQALNAGAIYGGDASATAGLGSVMGELTKIFPKKSKDDIGDLAVLLSASAGRHEAQLGKRGFKAVSQLTEQGMGGEEALAVLLASMEKSQGAAGATALASWKATGGKGTMPAAVAPLLSQLQKRDYGKLIREAQAGDLMKSEIATVGANADLQQLALKRRTAAYEKRVEYDERAEAMEIEAGASFYEAQMRQRGVSAPMRWVNRKAYAALTAAGVSPGKVMGGGSDPRGEDIQAAWALEKSPEARKQIEDRLDRLIRVLESSPGEVRVVGGETLEGHPGAGPGDVNGFPKD